jgi:hypothetical protein
MELIQLVLSLIKHTEVEIISNLRGTFLRNPNDFHNHVASSFREVSQKQKPNSLRTGVGRRQDNCDYLRKSGTGSQSGNHGTESKSIGKSQTF